MKLAAAVLSGASIVALSLAVAAPANAAGNAIDPGDSLFAINCDDIYNDFQLFGVDSTTAFSTAIGDGSGAAEDSCAGQPAYDPSTGKSYYIQWVNEGPDLLAEIDVTTGESAVVGDFYYDNGEFPEFISADALAIGADGSAFVLDNGSIWSVDLDSGWVTPIAETQNGIYSFAFDSVTGKFYGITYANEIFEIDVVTGAATSLGFVDFSTPEGQFHRTYSLQFDEAGTLWVEVDNYGEGVADYYATLWSFTLETLDAPVYSGIFTDDPFYTEAILIVPGTVVVPVEPALAATGADSSALLPLGLGAGLIVLAGGALVIVRRRTSAAAE